MPGEPAWRWNASARSGCAPRRAGAPASSCRRAGFRTSCPTSPAASMRSRRSASTASPNDPQPWWLVGTKPQEGTRMSEAAPETTVEAPAAEQTAPEAEQPKTYDEAYVEKLRKEA